MVSHIKHVPFNTFRPSTFILPLIRILGPSTLTLLSFIRTAHFLSNDRQLRPLAAHYGSKDRQLSSWTVHFGSNHRPVWLKTVHFWLDRPVSPYWTVHFGPDSSYILSQQYSFQVFSSFFIVSYLFQSKIQIKVVPRGNFDVKIKYIDRLLLKAFKR